MISRQFFQFVSVVTIAILMLSTLAMFAHATCQCSTERALVESLRVQVGRKQRDLALVTAGVVAAATLAAMEAAAAAGATGAAAGSIGGPGGAAVGGTTAATAAAIKAAIKAAIIGSIPITIASYNLRDAQIDRDEANERLTNCLKLDKRWCGCYGTHVDKDRARSVANNRSWSCPCLTRSYHTSNPPCACPSYTPPSPSSGSTLGVR